VAWIALIADPDLAFSEMVVPSIVVGVGASMAIPTSANAVVGAVAAEAVGKAAGTNGLLRELGGVFGVAVAVAVFAGAGTYASAQAFSEGFAAAMGVAAGLALIGALAALTLPGRRPTTDPVPMEAVPARESGRQSWGR
jgi:hypothetical protein